MDRFVTRTNTVRESPIQKVPSQPKARAAAPNSGAISSIPVNRYLSNIFTCLSLWKRHRVVPLTLSSEIWLPIASSLKLPQRTQRAQRNYKLPHCGLCVLCGDFLSVMGKAELGASSGSIFMPFGKTNSFKSALGLYW